MRYVNILLGFVFILSINGCAPRQNISETDITYLLEVQKRLNLAEDKLKAQDEQLKDLTTVTSSTNQLLYKLDLENRLDNTEKVVKNIEKQVNELNLTAINSERDSEFDQRLKAAEGNIKQLDKNLKYMDAKTDKLDSKVGQIESKVSSLESLGFKKPPEKDLKKELFAKYSFEQNPAKQVDKFQKQTFTTIKKSPVFGKDGTTIKYFDKDVVFYSSMRVGRFFKIDSVYENDKWSTPMTNMFISEKGINIKNLE